MQGKKGVVGLGNKCSSFRLFLLACVLIQAPTAEEVQKVSVYQTKMLFNSLKFHFLHFSPFLLFLLAHRRLCVVPWLLATSCSFPALYSRAVSLVMVKLL